MWRNMWRVVPRALVFLGVALLSLALLMVVYAVPRIEKAPVDNNSRTVASASGTYFSFETGEQVTSDDLRALTNTVSDQEASTSSIAVYDQLSVLQDGTSQDAPKITVGESRIAIDRSTALPVDCCGLDPVDMEGLTVKWPFRVEQRAYPVWDGTLGAAVDAEFVETTELDGVEAYVFALQIPKTTVDTTPLTDEDGEPVEGQIVYEASKRYWVEPNTGRILDSTQDIYRAVELPDGEVAILAADIVIDVTDATMADNLELARSDVSSLGLARTTLPLGGGILGLVALAAGIILLRGERLLVLPDEDEHLSAPRTKKRKAARI